ncbi:hypothetical protein DPMN_163567 [Dreissena polymorpha]|uniref:Uncharacterized protein n=1 Tax=Dreissena polymorpha TaxID=45954 RepID=A0A9D4EX06_DREPO|nr:hypothetical protein DPMN_163567 [Dreissena polymorpha]
MTQGTGPALPPPVEVHIIATGTVTPHTEHLAYSTFHTHDTSDTTPSNTNLLRPCP